MRTLLIAALLASVSLPLVAADSAPQETLTLAAQQPAGIEAAAEPTLAANALLEEIKTRVKQHDWQQTEPLESRLSAVASSDISPDLRAELWYWLGEILQRQGRFQDAASAYQRGIDSLAHDAGQSIRYELYEQLGVAQAQQAHYPDAIQTLLKAEKLGKKLGKDEDPGLLIKFGAVFIYLEDWPRAIDYLIRADKAVAMLPPETRVNRASIYSNIGVAYLGRGDSETAYTWFKKSLAYARAHDWPTETALNNLGNILRDWGRDRDALAKFEEVAAHAIELKDATLLGVSNKNIGETWIKLGDRSKAAQYLARAKQIFAEADQRPKRLELYPVMIDNLEAMGRSAEALALMREFKALNDEIVNVESRARMGELESAIDLERKNRELLASERDRISQQISLQHMQAEQERRRIIDLALLAAVVALVVIAILLARDRRFKAIANQVLLHKTEQVETQRRRLQDLNEVMYRQSRQDTLTGLYNRRFLSEFMSAPGVEGASQSPPLHLQPILLIVADIDHFKLINDAHGHAVGDRVLCLFADVLRDCGRDSDRVIRWGGEEFLWVCPATRIEDAPALCERLRKVLRERAVDVDGTRLRVTASLGFASYPLCQDADAEWEFSVRVADYGMYESKRLGRDNWTGFAARSLPADGAATTLPMVELESGGHIHRISMASAVPPASTST